MHPSHDLAGRHERVQMRALGHVVSRGFLPAVRVAPVHGGVVYSELGQRRLKIPNSGSRGHPAP